MVVTTLCAQITQVKLRGLITHETSNGHGAGRSLWSVKTAIVTINVGVAACTVRWINTWPCHADGLLGQVARTCATKVSVEVNVRHFPFHTRCFLN